MPPRPKMESCHRLLLFPLSFWRCDFDTKVTGSPFAGDGSREGSVEEAESARKRRRMVDIMTLMSHVVVAQGSCIAKDDKQIYFTLGDKEVVRGGENPGIPTLRSLAS